MKRCIVTGASSGIGFSTAKILSAKGYKVYALARSEEKLKELSKHNKNIHPVIIDLADPNAILAFAKQLEQSAEKIDALLNNAGLLINKAFADLSDNDWFELFQVNVMATVRLSRALLPIFAKKSHILNISSMGGLQGTSKFSGLSAYSTTKGALTTLTETLAEELAVQEISVNCLCLGAVQTEMLAKAFPDFAAPIGADEMAEYVAESLENLHKVMNGKILPIALSTP